MKKYYFLMFIIVSWLFCSGCPGRYLLNPESSCVPLSSFDTLVIAPMDGESTVVEEFLHKHIPPSFALAATRKIQEATDREQLFKQTIIATDCQDKAVKMEARILYITQKRSKFYALTKGRIIDCRQNKVLYTFDFEERADGAFDLSQYIGAAIHNGIEDRLKCEPDKKPSK